MKILSDNPKIEIWNDDCLNVLKTMPDKSVDLVITSPPYNTGNKSLGYHPNSATGDKFYDEYEDDIPDEQYKQFLFKTITECIRVSKYTFWNIQMLSGNKDIILDILFNFRSNLKDIFIWEKQAVSQIVRGRMAKGYEFVLCFGIDNNMTFNSDNFPKNGYVPNIKTWYKKESIPEHHATFPIELPTYFIRQFSKETDLVLDPFMGSGTTGVACANLDRNFIGIEISPAYTKIAEERIMRVINQQKLF